MQEQHKEYHANRAFKGVPSDNIDNILATELAENADYFVNALKAIETALQLDKKEAA